MNAVLDIQKKKELFDLPFKQNELEYWGPTNREFSNSFLAVVKDFLERISIEKISQKRIFTAIIELIQNIPEYYEIAYRNLPCYPDVYFKVNRSLNSLEVRTANKLKAEDVKKLSELFDAIFSLTKADLDVERAKAILKGKSLGLIMIRRMEKAKLDYSIQQIGEDNWLLFDLKIET